MSAVTIQQMADRVSALLEERLRLKGGDLSDKLRRAGRRLPRKVRDAGEALVAATQMAQVPKLLMQIDDGAVAIAYDICLRHLNTLNPAAARRGMLLNMLASIGFSLLVVVGLVILVLYLRGFV